jgi:Invasion associated locus B (IalB) protein
MQRKTILSRLAGAASILLAGSSAAPAADSSVSLVPIPPQFWQKQCDQTAAEHPCWVEQFAIAMPNKVVVAHIRFDIQQGGKTGIIVFAPLGVALIPGLQLILDGGKPPLMAPLLISVPMVLVPMVLLLPSPMLPPLIVPLLISVSMVPGLLPKLPGLAMPNAPPLIVPLLLSVPMLPLLLMPVKLPLMTPAPLIVPPLLSVPIVPPTL